MSNNLKKKKKINEINAVYKAKWKDTNYLYVLEHRKLKSQCLLVCKKAIKRRKSTCEKTHDMVYLFRNFSAVASIPEVSPSFSSHIKFGTLLWTSIISRFLVFMGYLDLGYSYMLVYRYRKFSVKYFYYVYYCQHLQCTTVSRDTRRTMLSSLEIIQYSERRS